MSDAQSVQGDTTPGVTAPAASNVPRSEPVASGRWIRLLAAFGALLFAYAMWIPWAVVTATVGGRSTAMLVDPNSAFELFLARIGNITPTPFEVAFFSMLGLLLAPLLWRPADSLLGAIATHIFGLWVVFATALVILFSFSPAITGVTRTSHGEITTTYTGQFALGYWVAVGALVVLWVAIIALLIWEWRRHAFWHLPGGDTEAPRSFIQLPGASVLNLGLLIWAYGFLASGWAALNCNQTPLFVGSCQGTPASGALSAGIAQATSGIGFTSAFDPNILLAIDPSIALHALGILLVGGAFLIFVGVWLRAVTRTFCVWTTLWLLLAVALVGVAYSGVGAIVAHPTQYGFPAGTWTAETGGALITLLGLIIAICGLVTVAIAALRTKAE